MAKNLVCILSRLPYPPLSGDKITGYHLLKTLAKQYDVHTVIVTEESITKETEDFIDSVSKSYKIFTHPELWFYFNDLKSLQNKLPLQINHYFLQEAYYYVSSISRACDVGVAALTRTARYLVSNPIPKVLVMTDSVGQNYKNSYQRTKSLFWKEIYKAEYPKLLKYEQKMIDEYDKTILVDKNQITFFDNQEKLLWVPYGAGDHLDQYHKKDPNYKDYVAFLGRMDYQPNVDAVLWFNEKVLPLLDPRLKFIIIGSKPSRSVLELEKNHPNIEVTGFLYDPYLILNSCHCMVAPMQSGGGIQNKVLENMALGALTFTTYLSGRPIVNEVNNKYLVMEDDPVQMAELINDALYHPEKYEPIKRAAKEYIKTYFNWDLYEQKMLTAIEEVIKRKAESSFQFQRTFDKN